MSTDFVTIFSAESKPYMEWQSILLAYTHQKIRQPGFLVCCLSGTFNPNFLNGYSNSEIFSTPLFTYNKANNDHYVGYNRHNSFQFYLNQLPVGQRTFLVLDSDMVFTRAWAPNLDPTAEIGEYIWYVEPEREPGRTVIQRYARRHKDRVQPIGFPLVMHESALREVLGRWCSLTDDLRADPWVREKANWITDMWALNIAAAELEVHFNLGRNCSFTGEQEVDRPLIHYTYSTESPSGYRWDKREHQPWNPLPPLKPDVPGAGKIFHQIYSSFIEEKRFARPLG